MSIHFTVTPSYEDYLASNWLIFRRHWLWMRTVRVMAISTLLCWIILSFDDVRSGKIDGYGLFAAFALAIGVAGAVFAVALLFSAIQIGPCSRRTFNQLGTVDIPTAYQLNLEQVQISNQSGVSTLPWGGIMDMAENERIMLLRRTAGMFFLIPKAQLQPSTLNETRSLLSQVGIKKA